MVQGKLKKLLKNLTLSLLGYRLHASAPSDTASAEGVTAVLQYSGPRGVSHKQLSAAGARVTSVDRTKFKVEACFESSRAIIVKRTDRSVNLRVDLRERIVTVRTVNMRFMHNSRAPFYFSCVIPGPPIELAITQI